MNFDRIRALLLEQAVHGKLVPQLGDEPAVEQIGEAPKVEPFAIPKKWKWVQLGNVINYGKIKQISPNELNHKTWILDLEDIQQDTGILLRKKRGSKICSNKAYFKRGNVLFSKLRPYLNKVIVADEDGVCTTEIIPLSVEDTAIPLDNVFLQIYLMSPLFVNYAVRCSYGMKMPRLGTKDAKSALMPVPPISEQHRIVAKVEKSLYEIDRAEKAYRELQTLAGVLRGKILQEAVMGKLVPQLDDEPAVKQIGKVPDDVPFLIPEKWKWIAAQDAYELLSGRDLQKGKILDVEPEAPSVPYITGASQIIDSRVLITRWTQNCSVKSVKGDLLLTCKGTVGKTAFNTVGDMHIARQIMALRAKPEIVEGKFLRLFIDSIAETLAKNAKSMIPGIDRKTLLKNSIPIPPLKEQRRIVAKLEELMKQVDALSA